MDTPEREEPGEDLLADVTAAENPISGQVDDKDAIKQIGTDKGTKGRPYLPFEQPDDQIGPYQIVVKERLEKFDTKNAKAYKATDTKNPGKHYYALVCNNTLPSRIRAIQKLGGFKHAHFITPLAYGVIPISALKECRLVIVYDMPKGLPLSTLLANEKKLSEKFIIKEVLLPLSQIIEGLQQRQVIHGLINPDNIYYSEHETAQVVLGECFSEPTGYAQSFFYEPVERAMAIPLGRGEEDHAADYFALGVLVLHLLLGFNPVQNMKKEEYFETCLSKGVFNTLVGNREFSGMIDDLLKGLFAEKQRDRWGPTQIRLWLGGKKYNLLRPAAPREGPRPFLFEEEPYFNRKHLAYALWTNWSTAKAILRQPDVARWIELSLKNPDLAGSLTALISMTGGETGRTLTDDDDLIAKTIILLHPTGPMRLHNVSTHLSGLGPLLAKAMHEKQMPTIQTILRMFDGEYTITWSDAFSAVPGFSSSELLWFIEKRRQTFKLKTFGFGMERILYDLNPALPCQSPMILKYFVTHELELLYLLESLPPEVTRAHDPVDAHIAAFLASKMDILKAINTSVDQFPHLKDNKHLKALALLAHAQRKHNNPPLPHLTRWCAQRLKPVLNMMHSKSLRDEMIEEIDKLSLKGNLALLHKLLTNVRIIKEDVDGFRRARMKYLYNTRKIEQLNRKGTLEERAERMGQKFASLVAYTVFLITMVRLVQDYFEF